ncbi:MAG: M23 family metallopeptidase [bacterium]|nr:M23 family metallopeptidase [bacterium]
MKFIYIMFFLFFLSGCGTGYGIYHKVAPGETFDGICEVYGINKDSVARINNILDRSAVKEGDAIYIPGADRRRSAVSASRHGVIEERPVKREAAPRETSVRAPLPPKKEEVSSEKDKTPSSGNTVFIWPVKGEILLRFVDKGEQLHDGIDIASDLGGPVMASASGRVIYSGSDIKGYGNMIILKHKGSYSSVYAHNSENKVKKGSFVKAGDIIALVGKSGRINAPALHFEIRNGKNAVDPIRLLP